MQYANETLPFFVALIHPSGRFFPVHLACVQQRAVLWALCLWQCRRELPVVSFPMRQECGHFKWGFRCLEYLSGGSHGASKPDCIVGIKWCGC